MMERLNPSSVSAIEAASNVVVSACSLYEINQKVRIRRLDVQEIDIAFIRELEDSGIAVIPVLATVMAGSASMEWRVHGREHRDPFDRMIAWTALELALPVMTSDHAFDHLKDLGLRTVPV
ncbi:type II toxin-antitoxin system VapC family toxin [Jannaschia sp. LMIT008]|uniref:type II toxin-antitoxin system VapC family toxin n=1 Tax=Jannaschia maritima TaxID=3032585 RepID=UPI002811F66A|nr:type II toxin-antitoxin system VapC family toxin [Jannaschia sp. LMIT008]